MIIKLLVEGGKMTPGPTLSQKIGPLGININKLIEKVNSETLGFKGLKVPVELNVNPSTKEFQIQVLSPPVSELLKKEIGVQKGSGLQEEIKIGNLSIEQIISVAKNKRSDLLCRDLKRVVKTVVGSCVSLGVLIESKPAKEIAGLIEEGKYDKELQEEKTETPPEKMEELKEYFKGLKEEQEKKIKRDEAAAKEKEIKTEEKEEK